VLEHIALVLALVDQLAAYHRSSGRKSSRRRLARISYSNTMWLKIVAEGLK